MSFRSARRRRDNRSLNGLVSTGRLEHMRRKRGSRIAHRSAGIAYWLAGIVVSVTAAILKTNVEWWRAKWEPAGDMFATLQNEAPFIILGSAILTGLARGVRHYVGDPDAWEIVREVLES